MIFSLDSFIQHERCVLSYTYELREMKQNRLESHTVQQQREKRYKEVTEHDECFQVIL